MVVQATSARRCRIWHEGAEREVSVSDVVLKLLPQGLVVGDQVKLRNGQAAEPARRRTVLVSRDADTMQETVVAANATRLLVLMSARQPDFHTTVLARHLLYAERQGIQPIICLTKADLVPGSEVFTLLKPFGATGYQTAAVSSTRKKGLEELKALLQGQTTAVMAVPGAGKTALLGALTGEPQPNVTSPRPIALAPDTWLIDMPGLRELGVWKPDLADGFRDFSAHAAKCNRPGCLHQKEPGCGVREAAERGHLQKQRYQQYLQLLQYMRLA